MREQSNIVAERSVMTPATEAAELLRLIAGNGEPGETKKAAWGRAYRRLSASWTYNRIKDLWRCEPRAKVSAEELEELRRVAGAAHDDGIGDRLARLEAWAARTDPDFFGPSLDALRRSYERMGR